MRTRLLFLLAAVSLCALPPRGAEAHPNARFYRGDVTVSTSWEGVIRLTGKLVIREGVTVTVEPGTEVLVQPGEENDIEVRGRLLVRTVAMHFDRYLREAQQKAQYSRVI